MGAKKAALLTCSPSSFVFDLAVQTFPRHSQLAAPSNRTMRLSNDKADMGPLAFKVMTTNRDRYRVKPTTGVLQPGQDIDVLLILSTADPLPADISAWSKDKFMVKAVAVAPGSSEATVKERWATASDSDVQQVKLGCAHRLLGEVGPDTAAPVEAAPSTAAVSELPKGSTAGKPSAAPSAGRLTSDVPIRVPELAPGQACGEPAATKPAAAKPAAAAEVSLERSALPAGDLPSRATPALGMLLLAHALSSLAPGAREGAFGAICLVLGAVVVFVVDRLCSWFCSGGALSGLCLVGVVMAASARQLVLSAD